MEILNKNLTEIAWCMQNAHRTCSNTFGMQIHKPNKKSWKNGKIHCVISTDRNAIWNATRKQTNVKFDSRTTESLFFLLPFLQLSRLHYYAQYNITGTYIYIYVCVNNCLLSACMCVHIQRCGHSGFRCECTRRCVDKTVCDVPITY